MIKQKDIITLIVVTIVSIFVSILISKFIFGSAKHHNQTTDVVPIISSNFQTPSTQYFNSQSIDPTQLIQIGNTTNPTPFSNPSTP